MRGVVKQFLALIWPQTQGGLSCFCDRSCMGSLARSEVTEQMGWLFAKYCADVPFASSRSFFLRVSFASLAFHLP